MQSIVDNSTKPYGEWIGGRVVPKVSPGGPHARVQARIAGALVEWVDRAAAGRVGTEWDFVITPPGDIPRTLVPDVDFCVVRPHSVRR